MRDGVLRTFDVDYLIAAEDVHFLTKFMPRVGINTVCEISAEFGRIARALLCSRPEISRYVVLDLPENHALSHAYLSRSLPRELFDKIDFESVSNHPNSNLDCELWIQIDRFQEMSERTIAEFLSLLGGYATYAYFCNPVGKYRPEVAGLAEVSDQELGIALSSGLSQSIIDPWDDASIAGAQPRNTAAYTPPGFTCSAHEESRLRPFYIHALYSRTTCGSHR